MKQPTTVKEAKSMVKERWLDHRVEKLAKENDELREAVDELRVDLDEAHGRSKARAIAPFMTGLEISSSAILPRASSPCRERRSTKRSSCSGAAIAAQGTSRHWKARHQGSPEGYSNPRLDPYARLNSRSAGTIASPGRCMRHVMGVQSAGGRY